jgi:hypothetical protein
MDMVTRYQMRVSVYMLCVLLCAVTANGWFLAAWVIASCPADREYVYIQQNSAVQAIDARLWPTHQLNPGRRAENLRAFRHPSSPRFQGQIGHCKARTAQRVDAVDPL